MPPPSSTWFTQDPHWTWLIVVYFFMGAVAAGSYLTAAIVDLVGGEADKRLARLGYLIAFPLTLADGVLLIVDLGRPERFLHMLWKTEVGGPILKPWSPISLGAWLFGFFAIFTFLGFVRELINHRIIRFGWLYNFDQAVRRSVLDRIYHAFGILVALFMATYPGVLLATTNRPLWGDTALLAALFVVSAVALAASVITLIGQLTRHLPTSAIDRMERWEQFGIVATLLVLAALVSTLGPVLQIWLNVWGALVAIGAALLLVALPLRFTRLGRRAEALVVASLVLVGGFLLRMAIVMSNENVTALLGRG